MSQGFVADCSVGVAWVVGLDGWPERQSQPIEVRTNVPRIRVAMIQFATEQDIVQQGVLQIGGHNGRDQDPGTLRVQVAAERLELGRQ